MESKSENHKNLIMFIMGITILILSVVGLTYAFFTATKENSASSVINVETSSSASINYVAGSDLNFFAYEPGTSDYKVFSVSLINSAGGSISSKYEINWNISENTFEYDPIGLTNEKELVYSLYRSADNVNWTKVIDEADCTELTGNNTILDNISITAGSGETVTDYWKFEIKYLNLPKNQSYNEAKTLTSTFKVTNFQ